MIDNLPNLLVADNEGHIFDHPELKMTAMTGRFLTLPSEAELIPLPEGSRLYLLPYTIPYGFDPELDDFVAVETLDVDDDEITVWAVSAFLPPAYTRTLLPAGIYPEEGGKLPLYAYTGVGWKDDQFWVPALRIDIRQNWDIPNYMDDIVNNVRNKRAQFPANRLLEQLERCALEYGCGAAYNAYCDRWEFPIPTAKSCNSACVGCISLQEDDGCVASHERVAYQLRPDEITEVVVPHLNSAPEAVASFGQGCEGEPLTQWKLIEQAIRHIRQHTAQGTINLNTNGSLPNAVERLCQAGLQAIRVSINSAVPETYNRYYRPFKYTFDDVHRSLKIASDHGLFTTINLLMFPGVSDQEAEVDALLKLIEDVNLDMIQCRNLNIDPAWYMSLYPEIDTPGMGFPEMLDLILQRFPKIQFGYFNRPKEMFHPNLPAVEFSKGLDYPSFLKPYHQPLEQLADV